MVGKNHLKKWISFTNRKLIIILLIPFSFISDSCKKSGGIGYLKGYVYEEYQLLPVSGANIKMYKTTGGYPVLVGTTTTNEKGVFKFRYFRHFLLYEYFIVASSKECYSSIESENLNRRQVLQILLPSKAFLKIRITNNRNEVVTFKSHVVNYTNQFIAQNIQPMSTETASTVLSIRLFQPTEITFQALEAGYIPLANIPSLNIEMTKRHDTLTHHIIID